LDLRTDLVDAIWRKEARLLVLTRKASQSIVIGNNIVITILDVHRDQVRIGIEAPRDVDVHRQEVFEALQEANRQAAESSKRAIPNKSEQLDRGTD
jgi:carbon storage regulator